MARSVPGGGGMDMEKRVNPLSNDRVKLVALWSGILETDGRGEASFTLDIPQHSGSLRIMAVGYKDKAFGAESQNMVIADPIVISTPLPRFFSPGDTVLVPVMVSNTTKKSEKCKTTIEVEGPIDILGSAKETKTIDADGEQRFTFKLAVKRQLGQSKVTIKVEGGGETFENVTDITVRPASPLQKVNGSGIIQAGNTQQIKMDIARFMPKSVDNQLVVSKSPLIQFMDDLEYLVRYPYGCIEQTVSKAFPQLYYNDIAKLLYSDQEDNINIHHHVQVAIDKIKLMQLYNGGLTYWPGQGTETWWGSAYAAHFLVEAKKAGYDVDDDVLKDLLKYLRVKLKDKQLVYYYYNGNQRRKIVPKSIPYSLYILALADKPARSVMNYYKSDINDLSLDGKYLLAAAYGLTGSKKEFQEILPVAFEGEKSNTVFGGSFYSHLRDEAIALNAILEVDPENQQVGIMAKHVSESLKNKHYLNTQERTFSFLALGKIAREDAKTDASAIVKANGKQIGKVSDKAMTFNTAQLEGSNAEISVQGTGRMYYFWESEGISKDGSYREEDNYIKVRKKFYDRYGNPVEGNSFTQNDLVLVELSISKAYDKRIDNVVISDILPAGFEIENPRITVLPSGMEWPHQKSRYDYMDVRDDRINFFVDLYGTNTRYYYYLVRAVSMGTFQLGPVGADAMYNGEYHSYHGGGQIVVKEKR
jgi:alpha-2-macroglobulin